GGSLPPLLTAILVNTDVGDNAIQPGPKTPVWVVRLAFLPGLQEGLLCGVLGILRVIQYFPCDAIDAILIALHEESKSLAVTLLHMGKEHLVATVHDDSPALTVERRRWSMGSSCYTIQSAKRVESCAPDSGGIGGRAPVKLGALCPRS